MNSTIYLLGKFDQGYTQYPLDSSQDIFQKMADSMTSAKTHEVELFKKLKFIL